MWPDRVSNPGPLTYESGALPTALSGSAEVIDETFVTGLLDSKRLLMQLICTIPEW